MSTRDGRVRRGAAYHTHLIVFVTIKHSFNSSTTLANTVKEVELQNNAYMASQVRAASAWCETLLRKSKPKLNNVILKYWSINRYPWRRSLTWPVFGVILKTYDRLGMFFENWRSDQFAFIGPCNSSQTQWENITCAPLQEPCALGKRRVLCRCQSTANLYKDK